MTVFVLASAGGGPGPARRTGLDPVLMGTGYPAYAARSAIGQPSGIGPAMGPGGTGLGSAVPARRRVPVSSPAAGPGHRRSSGQARRT
jgi:hypothetical protein